MMNVAMRRTDIVIRKGSISLAKSVVSRLQLKEGDVISIMEDTKEGECYLYVQCRAEDVTGRYSGVCRRTKANSNHLRAYSSALCNFFADKFGTNHIDLIVGELTNLPIVGDALPIIMHNRYDRRSKI